MDKNLSFELIEKAKRAREKSYAPYSGYRVGAALLCADESVYTGCNIENASYSPTVCAERVAFFKAVSSGKRDFKAIAVVAGKENIEDCTPCGVCRQVMAEFCDKDTFEIIFIDGGEIKNLLLRDLLPYGFSPNNLK